MLHEYDLTLLLQSLATFLFKMNSSFYSLIVFSFTNILALLLTLSNFAFNVLLYFTITAYFLQDEDDIVDKMGRLLPVEIDTRERMCKTIKDSIKGIFLSNISIALFQAVYTWMIFDYT